MHWAATMTARSRTSSRFSQRALLQVLAESTVTSWRLAMEPVERLMWLRRAMVQITTGKVTATALFDAVTHPRFAARWSDEQCAQPGRLLQANLGLFSHRQGRAMLVEVPLEAAIAARRHVDLSNSSCSVGASG